MGNSHSHPIFLALQELLESKRLKMRRSTIERFLNECDTIAPWFVVSGSLSVACWDKLGRDLDFAWGQGALKPGVRPVWRLVRSCLEDQKCCQEALKKGRVALEMLQEERSEEQGSTKEIRAENLDMDEESEGANTGDELQGLIEQVQRQTLKPRRKGSGYKLEQEPPGRHPTVPPAPRITLRGEEVTGRGIHFARKYGEPSVQNSSGPILSIWMATNRDIMSLLILN